MKAAVVTKGSGRSAILRNITAAMTGNPETGKGGEKSFK